MLSLTLCPSVSTHSTPDISYCTLGGMKLSVENKIRFISAYIDLIDKETRFRPATIEFARRFNARSAVNIISGYCISDPFFDAMIHGCGTRLPIASFASSDIYFLLMELKLYLDERRAVLTRYNCHNTLSLIRQYKNHLSFGRHISDCSPISGCPGIYTTSPLYVPETPLYSYTGEYLPVFKAIPCIDTLLKHIQNDDSPPNSLAVYSFLVNFRNMLFNHDHDSISSEYIPDTIRYVYDLCDLTDTPDESSSPCPYASFVNSLIRVHSII